MTVGGRVSLFAGIAGGMVVGLALHLAQAGRTPDAQQARLMVVLAIAGGLVIGVIQWLFQSRQERELHRLAVQLESLTRPEAPIRLSWSGMMIRPLAIRLEAALRALRWRYDLVARRRREVTCQLRVAELELRRLRAVLDELHDAIVVTDAGDALRFANSAASHLLAGADERPPDARGDGLPAGDASALGVDTLLGDVRLLDRAASPTGSTPRPHRLEHELRVEGRRRLFDVDVRPLVADDVRDLGEMLTVLRDVTGAREVAAQRSDFVSSVSHELRTPLASIKAYVEMLADGEADDLVTRAEFYDVIQSETNRLTRLIDTILNIDRIETGVALVQRQVLPLEPLLRRVVDSLSPQARGKQITLRTEFAESPIPILADGDMIQQVAVNLIGNALKYTEEGGTVTVRTRRRGVDAVAELAVIDTGVGVPPDDVPHLFEKFHRVKAHRRMAQGTGLGLHLVKQIVETLHGGTVRVDSEVGTGSTFMCLLPLAEETGGAPRPGEEESDHDVEATAHSGG